ncbi:hypothetical protein [Gryllotalpicola koreensis]
MASTRVPQVRWLPMISARLLVITAVVVLISYERRSLLDGLLLVVAAIVASALTGGYLWSREGLRPSMSFWSWVWVDLTNPGYARGLRRAEHFQEPL